MRRRLAIAVGGIGLVLLILGLAPLGAYAEAPIRVGWWNTASANGTAAPSQTQTTPPGGIRVSAGPGATTPVGVGVQQVQVLAYGAVLYEAAEGSTGILTLKVAQTAQGGQPQSQGTPQLVACPTRNADWPGGDDQPAPGPDYDCDSQHFAGKVSADGNTVTFNITAELESTSGEVSLAIVPDLGSAATPAGTTPFAVDFNPPDESSFFPEETTSSNSSSFQIPSYSTASGPGVGAPLGLPALGPPPPVAAAAQPSPATVPPVTRTPAVQPAAADARLLLIRSRAATALGALLLLAAVALWSFGYGLLGGRVIPLSMPLRKA